MPHRVAAGWERLTAIARAAKAAGDPRKLDQLRADAMMDRLDDLVAHGITKVRRTKRRPTAEVAALVRARNRTCIAPVCQVPSNRCELDHSVTWADKGETEPGNLGPACPRHHHFRHSHGCQLVHFSPGNFGWQTPLGMQYMTKPDPPIYDDKRYLH